MTRLPKGQFRITLVLSLVPFAGFLYGVGLTLQEYFVRGYLQNGPGFIIGGLSVALGVWALSFVLNWIIQGFKKK